MLLLLLSLSNVLCLLVLMAAPLAGLTPRLSVGLTMFFLMALLIVFIRLVYFAICLTPAVYDAISEFFAAPVLAIP